MNEFEYENNILNFVTSFVINLVKGEVFIDFSDYNLKNNRSFRFNKCLSIVITIYGYDHIDNNNEDSDKILADVLRFQPGESKYRDLAVIHTDIFEIVLLYESLHVSVRDADGIHASHRQIPNPVLPPSLSLNRPVKMNNKDNTGQDDI